MELFDAAGGGATADGRADALAAALASLAAPLERIASATEGAIPILHDISGGGGGGSRVQPKPLFPGDETFIDTPLEPRGTHGPKPSQAKPIDPTHYLAQIAQSTGQMVPLLKGIAYNTAQLNHRGLSGAAPPVAKEAAGGMPLGKGHGISAITGGKNVIGAGAKDIGFGGGAMSGLMSAIGPAVAALGAVGGAAAAVVGPLVAVAGAAAGMAAAIGGLVLLSREFTQIFDPTAVQAFDAALRDLAAIVGVVLSPVVTEATRFLRAFAASLFPIVDSALPAMRMIARAVTDVLIAWLPAVSSLVSAFAALAPVVAELARLWADFMMPIIRGATTAIAGLMVVVKAVIGAWVNALGAILGNDIRGKAMSLGQMFGRLIVVVSALVFNLLGMKQAINAMIGDLAGGGKGLAGQRDATGLAAAQNARLVGVADLGREVAQRAFGSSGRAGNAEPDMDDAAFRKQLIIDLKAIGAIDLKEKIKTALREFIAEMMPNPANVMKGLGQQAGGAALAPANAIARFLGLPEVIL